MTDSFWRIPTERPTGVPLQLLREQSEKLTEETNGNLRGEIETAAFGSELRITMSIRVIYLNNYVVEILIYTQPVNMFPGQLILTLSNRTIDISNFEDFSSNIRMYLSSPGMGRIIASLMAQAGA
jgi:hypothetical protein